MDGRRWNLLSGLNSRIFVSHWIAFIEKIAR